jgi:hypothetical protein
MSDIDPRMTLTAYWWGLEVPNDASKIAEQSLYGLTSSSWSVVPTREIDRLRNELITAGNCGMIQRNQLAKAEAEIDRLRARISAVRSALDRSESMEFNGPMIYRSEIREALGDV